MIEGVKYKGYIYPFEDIERAVNNLGLDPLMVALIVDSNGAEGLIEVCQKHGAMPKPWRENDRGYALYLGFIAQDIWEIISVEYEKWKERNQKL
jgi:hypothetical protein